MLEEYEKKRDFSATPEPWPQNIEGKPGPLRFTVQKHNAHNLHYDLRLEVHGVLKSWAVPHGPSLDPGVRRLAVQVEDHPIDYASFEGVIPEGQYGAGEVIVWDRGVYYPGKDRERVTYDRAEDERIISDDIEKGRISVYLEGRKLKGGFALAHTRDRNWLLIKRRDEFARKVPDILDEEKSVLSGLTIRDLREKSGQASNIPASARHVPGAVEAPLPDSILPMLAMLAERPFSSPDWFFEPKMDGIRVIAIIRDKKVKLLSRRQHDISLQYPSVIQQLQELPVKSAILDGEICALDKQGRPSFQELQGRINLSRREDIIRAEDEIPVYYYLFDLLYFNDFDLRHVKLSDRKGLLAGIVPSLKRLRLLDYFEGDGEMIYAEAVKHGFEGIIAKEKDSLYETGIRSRRWLKVKKVVSDDFIIGGYTRGKGNREKTFGSLLLGYYDDSGRLTYAGNVGSGFDEAFQAALKERMDGMQADRCPFYKEPPLGESVIWVEPGLVAEVRFAEWTREGYLRSPVFLRLRPDKPAGEVHPIRETEPPPPLTAEDSHANDVLAQLDNSRDTLRLQVEGQTVSLNNLNKELWPAVAGRRALTKRDLIAYLARVGPYILPHLRNRPLTLSRYPDGINGEQFFQKHWTDPLPCFMRTVSLESEHAGGSVDYLMCDNLPSLLWLGQLADLELHTWYSRIDHEPDMVAVSQKRPDNDYLAGYPDFIIFDIDPYIYSGRESPGSEPGLNRQGFERGRDVALWLKQKLDMLSLTSFVKTSGKTGIHVYVPILRQFDYDAVRSAARTVCTFLFREHTDLVTLEWAVDRRRGKIFLDYNQNVKGKTLASPYSPRPVPEASVSTPLTWDELDQAYPANYTILNIPERLSRRGDPWSGIISAKSDLAALLEKR